MKKSFRGAVYAIVTSLSLFCSTAWAEDNTYVPTSENIQAREEFQDNKFGIFLHWGIYSMPAQGEWYMNNRNISRDEYSKLASGFYPSHFDAAKWVSAIKASGARYLCITSRHHDGFSMFKTATSDYNIVDGTPYHRDILKELADECHRQNIGFHVYYSHLDWYREDYPLGRTGHGTRRPKGKENWNSYYAFMNQQLTEILTNYGKVNALWFDGVWDHKEKTFDWQLEEQYRLIHKLQPACLIGNNHHHTPVSGEDFQMFERDLPGENKGGHSAGLQVSSLPLETCETMNGMWGYRIEDQNYKSSDSIVRLLVRSAGKNANLLLNIGPQPNGDLPALALNRLHKVGEWLGVYGETIYGTRGGDIAQTSWGVSTRKGNKLYLHVLDRPENGLLIAHLNSKVKNAKLFYEKSPVAFSQKKGVLNIKLPDKIETPDCVIELTLKR